MSSSPASGWSCPVRSKAAPRSIPSPSRSRATVTVRKLPLLDREASRAIPEIVPRFCRSIRGLRNFHVLPLYLGTLTAYDGTVVPEVATYSIGAVARMVRVPPATLRTWEERYGIVQPVRSEGGHRLYSRHGRRAPALRRRPGTGGDLAGRRAPHARPGYPATSRSPAADAGTQVVILLAERDPYAAEFAEFFLKTEGFEVVLALDAADAVLAVGADRPQLAIIDLLISGAPGSSCAETSMPAGSRSWPCPASRRAMRRSRPARPRSCRSRSSRSSSSPR